MLLNTLKLINFKNYEDETISFEPGINCIIGRNGSGKTNLMDAIHYLSMTKSAFNSIDSQNIRYENDFFSIIGTLTDNAGDHRIFCSLKKGEKKVLKYDNSEYEKLSEHIGTFPSVLITPYDSDVINGGNEIRRRFFDSMISQIDQNYLKDLISYNHNLKQRNSLLKYFRDNLIADHDLIMPYNQVLYDLGSKIFNRRFEFNHSFLPIFKDKYSFITENEESVDLTYVSHFSSDDAAEQINDSLTTDIEAQRTMFGTHRDQWKFVMNDHDLKKFGSQGQQKTYLISVKTAQFDLLKKTKGFAPILLLDDIFDKLDDNRIHQLMHMLTDNQYGQIFLTDARDARTKSILESLDLDRKMIHINKGKITD